MTGRNPRFESYFAKPQRWQAEFNALRQIVLGCGLTEELKWRQPCYTFEGRNVVILSGFKAFCALGFFKGSLMPDPHHMLIAPGENSRAARMLRFEGPADISAREDIIADYVRAAIAIEQSGARVDFSANKSVEYPDELEAAFASDAAYRNAFEALTPGRRRAWVLQFDGAKQSATKSARIAKARETVLQGLGPQDAYRKNKGKP